jgi:hypothetical protein
MEWRQDNDWRNLDNDQSCTVELPRTFQLVEQFNPADSEILNPYCFNGKNLSFQDFPDILNQTADSNGKVNIKIVVGSGRYKEADHVSYGTDCIGLPEITTLLDSIPQSSISSCLDIDIFHTKEIEDQNLVLLGSGKVNYVTMKLLDRFKDSLGFKFNHPEYSTLHSSSSGKTYVDGDQDDWGLGILCLMRNPWASDVQKQRIVVLIAGFHPLGSMASNDLLRNFILNPIKRENNKFDGSVPIKIVRGKGIDFNDYVKKITDVIETPIRNKTYIGSLNGETQAIE